MIELIFITLYNLIDFKIFKIGTVSKIVKNLCKIKNNAEKFRPDLEQLPKLVQCIFHANFFMQARRVRLVVYNDFYIYISDTSKHGF